MRHFNGALNELNPRTTTEISPSTFGVGGGTANVVQPYKLREVPGGKSEIRPIVTVKRSKTTAGESAATSSFISCQNPNCFDQYQFLMYNVLSASLHYKATSIQALHKNTFGGNKYATTARGVTAAAAVSKDFNHNTIPHPGGRSRKHNSSFNVTEELCEFQVSRAPQGGLYTRGQGFDIRNCLFKCSTKPCPQVHRPTCKNLMASLTFDEGLRSADMKMIRSKRLSRII